MESENTAGAEQTTAAGIDSLAELLTEETEDAGASPG